MSEGKHTPGPWHYGTYLITSEPGNVITGSINYPLKVADGHLIAAAPDLLEALKELDTLVDFSERLPDHGSWDFECAGGINAAMEKARAAIAKAEGRKAE